MDWTLYLKKGMQLLKAVMVTKQQQPTLYLIFEEKYIFSKLKNL